MVHSLEVYSVGDQERNPAAAGQSQAISRFTWLNITILCSKQFWRRVRLLWCVICGATGMAEARDPQSYFFNESFGNFAEELNNGREQGKQVI